MAASVIARAARLPGEQAVAQMAAQALGRHPADLTAAEIRGLADEAMEQARKVSALLRHLADLVGEAGGGARVQG